MNRKSVTAAVLTLFFLVSCAPIQAEKKTGSAAGYPPVVRSVENPSPGKIVLSFDKEINAEKESFSVSPGIDILEIRTEGRELTLIPAQEPEAGKEYFIRGTVYDAGNNSVSLGASFFGFNPRVPAVLINEFTSNGSGNHPDMAELYVTAGGNLAGITLYGGTKSSYTDKFVFPALEVGTGDFIIVHFKPEGLDTEINETENRNQAAGRDSSEEAWDFWISGGSGLSGNNGVISLYSNPYGSMMDCVIYTNRTSDSDTAYRGFGSTKLMLQVDEAAAEGGWKGAGDTVRPEDCVSSALTTATRSCGRNSGSADTDTAGDWHTVPTSKFSFGKKNSDDIYVK